MPTITRAEFLSEFQPEHPSWACDAPPQHITTPSEARIRQGWVIEKPMHTFFNWYMNQADTRIASLEARVAWLEKCLAGQIIETEI